MSVPFTSKKWLIVDAQFWSVVTPTGGASKAIENTVMPLFLAAVQICWVRVFLVEAPVAPRMALTVLL